MPLVNSCQTPQNPRADAAPKVILSRELFRDGPVLRIVHGEQVYVLRRTSTDKLILTK